MLYIDSLLDLVSSLYGRFLELLSAAELAYHSCLLEFTFEFLESLLYALIGTIIILLPPPFIRPAKIGDFIKFAKIIDNGRGVSAIYHV